MNKTKVVSVVEIMDDGIFRQEFTYENQEKLIRWIKFKKSPSNEIIYYDPMRDGNVIVYYEGEKGVFTRLQADLQVKYKTLEVKEYRTEDVPDVWRYPDGSIKHADWDEYEVFWEENGVVGLEEWHYETERSTKYDLPSCITHYKTSGKIQEKEWSLGGSGDYLPRPNDKPNKIKYYENGNVKSEHWLVDNSDYFRRNDLPSKIKYYENGNVKSKTWRNDTGYYYIKDYEERPNNKPNHIEYNENGSIKNQEWLDEGDKPNMTIEPRIVLV